MIVVFAVLLFLAVVVLIAGVMLHRREALGRALTDRLRGIRRGAPEKAQRSAERDSRYSTVPWLDGVLRRIDAGKHFELLLYQAGVRMRPGVLVLLIAAASMTGYAAGILLMNRLLPGLVFMAVLGPAPYFYVRFRKHQRMKAFAREFPDALDLLVSGLRAGLSFLAALQIVAEESPEPVRGEFAMLIEEQSLGLEFRDAMINMTERVDVLDLRFFVTAVLLQRETGGNLAEVLANTASLIRERFRVLGDIQTFTAQGKLTGAILVGLPVVVALFTAVAAPEYFKPMLESHAGRLALGWAAGLQLAGVLVIARIVNIRV